MNKNKYNLDISGSLGLEENSDKLDYILYQGEYGEEGVNISEILKDIYYNYPIVKIRITNGRRILFNEDGELYLQKTGGIWEYFIDDRCLGDILFNNTNKNINIEIRTHKSMRDMGVKN